MRSNSDRFCLTHIFSDYLGFGFLSGFTSGKISPKCPDPAIIRGPLISCRTVDRRAGVRHEATGSFSTLRSTTEAWRICVTSNWSPTFRVLHCIILCVIKVKIVLRKKHEARVISHWYDVGETAGLYLDAAHLSCTYHISSHISPVLIFSLRRR